MSDQNNNNNNGQQPGGQPQQPYQGQQPYKPYQGQPQQPYQGQPYQGQPQQPYQGQPYQGQPQPYQPYQGQPYRPYQGQPPMPPKKKSRWWIWLIVAAAVVITVVALFLLGVIPTGGGVKRAGNEGAWKTYDYLDTMEEKIDRIMSANYKEISDRFEAEAFELEGDFEINSDLFDTADLGIEKFSADFEAKYDLKDLGIKLDIFGAISADIYLIEEDVVLSLLGQAYAMPLDPNTDVDLGEEMPLKDRMDALSALSANGDFNDLLERVMAELAPAIPDEFTEKETADVYSPLEDDEVEMKATTTTLEKDDLYDIIVAFGENLEQNEELLDDLQDFLDTIEESVGEDLDIDDLVDDMIELDEDELDELDDFTISWSVYEYKGSDVGISVYYDNGTDEVEIFLVTEYTNDSEYSSINADYNGDEVLNLVGEIVYSGEEMTLDMEIDINIPEDEYTDAQQIVLNISGNTLLEKDSSTEYIYSADFTIDIDAGDSASDLGMEGPVSIDLEVNADCLFGNDLGSLEDDDDWNEIYDMDWGDIDDLMDGLFNFGGLGNFDSLGNIDEFTF